MNLPDPFDRLVPEARTFLRELAGNNTRDWFTANKARYDRDLKGPATHLLDQVAQDWGGEIDRRLSTKLFRAHRDVRFSRDKTPYHTHLHMLWAEPEGPAWFLGISPDYTTAGAGIMGFNKEQLVTWRASVDGPRGRKMADLLVSIPARIDEPELKRVPAPYDKTHANAALLRRKSLTLWVGIGDKAEREGLVTALVSAFRDIRPAVELLREMV